MAYISDNLTDAKLEGFIAWTEAENGNGVTQEMFRRICTQAMEANYLRERVAELEAALATSRRDALEEAAHVCHKISIAAFIEREKQRDGDFDYCSISEETGRYESAGECEMDISALAEREQQAAPALSVPVERPIDLRTEICRIISDMLDAPNAYGIYPTSKCFNKLEAMVIRRIAAAQKEPAVSVPVSCICPPHEHRANCPMAQKGDWK